MNKNQILAEECFKIDQANSWAMIDGFPTNNGKINQAIYCITNKEIWGHNQCRLITYDDTIPYRDKLSDIGKKLIQDKNWKYPELRYIAITDTLYKINYEFPNLWKELCSNGIFDIWLPTAPKQRFVDFFEKKAKKIDHHEKGVKKRFEKTSDKLTDNDYFCGIALIRLYEIEGNGFSKNDFHYLKTNDFAPHLDSNKLKVAIKQPIICKEEFFKIKYKLEGILQKPYLVDIIPIVDTTKNDNSISTISLKTDNSKVKEISITTSNIDKSKDFEEELLVNTEIQIDKFIENNIGTQEHYVIITDNEFIDRYKKQIESGHNAEYIVFIHEQKKLEKIGRADLAKLVEIVSGKIGLGYDILSFELTKDNEVIQKQIEVKSVQITNSTRFYLTENEYEKSKRLSNFCLYLVDNTNDNPIIIKLDKPDFSDSSKFELKPSIYEVRYKK